jgi:hypothetical protein
MQPRRGRWSACQNRWTLAFWSMAENIAAPQTAGRAFRFRSVAAGIRRPFDAFPPSSTRPRGVLHLLLATICIASISSPRPLPLVLLLLPSRHAAPRLFRVWRKWDPRQPFRHLDLWRGSRVP